MNVYPKRLIEVDLPIKRISANARKGGNGKITGLHRWWARRPLGVCRAVACAASWPDPADEWCPPAFRAAAGKLMSDLSRGQESKSDTPWVRLTHSQLRISRKML